jgi:Tfp pilus assembly protein PilV
MIVKLKITQKNKCGFLLLEIMVALMAFGCATLFLAQFYWKIIAWHHESVNYGQAIDIISTYIEWEKESPSNAATYYEEKGKHSLSATKHAYNHAINSSLSIDQESFRKKCIVQEIMVSWKGLHGESRNIKMIVSFFNDHDLESA